MDDDDDELPPPGMYECDRCGACCTQLIVEIQHLDVVREPRLLAVAEPFKMMPGADSEWDREYMLACGSSRPCRMLGPDKLCQIHPTRPNVCVAFQAGSGQCQEARRCAGLPPLPPKEQASREQPQEVA